MTTRTFKAASPWNALLELRQEPPPPPLSEKEKEEEEAGIYKSRIALGSDTTPEKQESTVQPMVYFLY